MVDMRKFASGLLRPEDLHDGNRTEKIVGVSVSDKLGAPILTFESGDEMVAWNQIARVLGRTYGYQDTDWIGHVVELSVGHYVNKDGEQKENIQVKAISAPEEKQEVKPIDKDLNDEVPF
jgi:hypothetical protein